MTKISDIVKAQASDTVKALNPEVFRLFGNAEVNWPAYLKMRQELVNARKPVKTKRGANKGHSNILSDRFKSTWKLLNGPKLEEEYRFHEKRRWRFDFVHLKSKVAIEINGGVWINGRHNRGQGYINDMEKINEAQFLGYKVFQLYSGTISAINIKRLILFIQKDHLNCI